MAVYHRILLKLSGEALKSGSDLFDFEKVNEVASIVRRMHDMGVEVGIVIGAGNIWRGRQGPAANMDAVTADQMGMLGTVINCLCVADALRKAGLDAIVQSAVDMNRFAEPFNAMAARRHLSEGRIVLFACGTGNPFFSTDSGVARPDGQEHRRRLYRRSDERSHRHHDQGHHLYRRPGQGAQGHGCFRLRPLRGEQSSHGPRLRPG